MTACENIGLPDTGNDNCQSELATTKASLSKSDSLLTVCNAALTTCELQGETDGENYTVKVEAVTAYLADVQTQISEAEKALFNLSTITDQDVSDAIKATNNNILVLKGQRKAIGDIFKIQVQN